MVKSEEIRQIFAVAKSIFLQGLKRNRFCGMIKKKKAVE